MDINTFSSSVCRLKEKVISTTLLFQIDKVLYNKNFAYLRQKFGEITSFKDVCKLLQLDPADVFMIKMFDAKGGVNFIYYNPWLLKVFVDKNVATSHNDFLVLCFEDEDGKDQQASGVSSHVTPMLSPEGSFLSHTDSFSSPADFFQSHTGSFSSPSGSFQSPATQDQKTFDSVSQPLGCHQGHVSQDQKTFDSVSQPLGCHQGHVSPEEKTFGSHLSPATQDQKTFDSVSQPLGCHQEHVSPEEKTLGCHQEHVPQDQKTFDSVSQPLGCHQGHVSPEEKTLSCHQEHVSPEEKTFGCHQEHVSQDQKTFDSVSQPLGCGTQPFGCHMGPESSILPPVAPEENTASATNTCEDSSSAGDVEHVSPCKQLPECFLVPVKPFVSQVEKNNQDTTSPGQQPWCSTQVTTSPGQMTTSPGQNLACSTQVSTSPGQMITYPGQQPWCSTQNTTSPGQMVTSPGQMATSPGLHTTSPGQMITSPGLHTTSPGQMVTSPGLYTTSPGQMLTYPGQQPWSSPQQDPWNTTPETSPKKQGTRGRGRGRGRGRAKTLPKGRSLGHASVFSDGSFMLSPGGFVSSEDPSVFPTSGNLGHTNGHTFPTSGNLGYPGQNMFPTSGNLGYPGQNTFPTSGNLGHINGHIFPTSGNLGHTGGHIFPTSGNQKHPGRNPELDTDDPHGPKPSPTKVFVPDNSDDDLDGVFMSPKEKRKVLSTYLTRYENVFSGYVVKQVKKLGKIGLETKKGKFPPYYFSIKSNVLYPNLYIRGDRIQAGGRLSIPQSISVKFQDTSITYHHKIVFSMESLETFHKDSNLRPVAERIVDNQFVKEHKRYKDIFWTNPYLPFPCDDPLLFKFRLQVTFISSPDHYCSSHATDITIKHNPEQDSMKVVFDQIKSFENLDLNISIFQTIKEQQWNWLMLALSTNPLHMSDEDLKDLYLRYP